MEIPWIVKGDPADEAIVMASKFQLASPWRSPAFLLYAIRLWRQALNAPGVLGVSLRAKPLSGTFWTLSAWTDQQALYAYAKAPPHRPAMTKIRPWMRDSAFRFWQIKPTALPAPRAAADLWTEAERRLAMNPDA